MSSKRLSFKALLIPAVASHVMMFHNVVSRLKGFDVLAIGIGKYGYPDLKDRFRELGIRFKNIEEYKREDPAHIIRVEKPNIVIVANDVDPPSSAFVRAANSANIPTLLIAEGTISKVIPIRRDFLFYAGVISNFLHSKNRLYLLQYWIKSLAGELSGEPIPSEYRGEGFGTGGCTKIAVWGESSKKVLIGKGVDPEKIVTTGNPIFDTFYRKKLDTQKIREKLNIGVDKKIVVLAPAGLVELGYWTKKEMGSLVKNVYETTKKLSDTWLVIKPHPRESVKDYEQYLGDKKPERTTVIKDIELHPLIAACEILTTDASTVGIEAVAFGKPVVVLNLTDKPYAGEPPAILVKEGVALGVLQEEEVKPTVEKLLRIQKIRKRLMDKRRTFIRKHLYKLDGRASERVANLIKQIVS